MEIENIFEIGLKITRDGVNRVAVYYGTQRLNLSDGDYQHFESILEDYEADEATAWPSRKKLIASVFLGER